MRYAEYALLLIPVAIVFAWFHGIRGLSVRGVAAFVLLFVIVGGMLYLFGTHRMFTGKYLPAHMEDGQIVPGKLK